MRYRRKQRLKISIRVLQVTMIGLGLLILGRLIQLQVVQYDTYSPLSRENSLRQEVIHPARGLIYDRNGRLIVDNEPIYSITITPARYDRSKTPLLADLLEIPQEEVNKRIDEAMHYSRYRASRLFNEISFRKFSLIQENIWRLPGIGHQIESKRHYPVDSMQASHMMGYLREVSEQQYLESDTYHMGDKVGKSGLEMVYEDRLRGTRGVEYIRVNARGQALGQFDNGSINEAPEKGNDLYTTLDTDLQLLAEDLMEDKKGAAIALNPNNGAVLSIVSSPQYNIRRLSGRIDSEYWQSINADTTAPLFNRAISSRQPPGSTFKPLMALMGLEMGIITPETEINNPGYYMRGRRYNDLADPGVYNVTKAIEQSSNTFFYWLMDQIATNGRLNQWYDLASEFGLGMSNGIDLPYEISGILPDSTYMDRTFGERQWGVGDLINLGIGQGVIAASPLQMALVVSGIANNGYRVQPHLVHQIRTPEGRVLQSTPQRHKISWVDQEGIDVVKEGMRRVVTDGSGRWFANLDSIKVAGKTGTAQNPQGIDHGWFICFAPLEDPQIAVAVLIENGGYGSISAAPVASLMIERYLKGEIEREWVYQRVKNFVPQPTDSNAPSDSDQASPDSTDQINPITPEQETE